MNMVITKKYMQKIALAVLLAAAGMLAALPVGAAVKPGAKYVGGNLTLEAKGATMAEVLETIARTAGIDVYVARGFQVAGEKLTTQIADEPLEEAIRRILRGYSYAAIYIKEGDDFRIAALKIYPEGQQAGEVVPLFSGGRTPAYEEKNRRGETVTVLVDARGEMVTARDPIAPRGVVGPSGVEVSPQARPADLQSPWVSLRLQQEREEAERFNALLLLRKQAESTADSQKREALTMVYADEAVRFQNFRKANMNKVESLKRINQFQELTGQ